MPIHFGVTVREGKHGLTLTRENYAVSNNRNSLMPFKSITYADAEGKFYTDEWCEKHLVDCMMNFDLNMEFFSALSHDEFDSAITTFCKRHNDFKSVSDLNIYGEKSGYYMMVLDKYCQVYIGTTDNIKHRIMSHWSKSKPFDRLLFPIGAVNTSMLSIDSFRAFDTTRIYVYTTSNTYEREDSYIDHYPPEFVCNRLAGGEITGGLVQAITMMKKRNLNDEKK